MMAGLSAGIVSLSAAGASAVGGIAAAATHDGGGTIVTCTTGSLGGNRLGDLQACGGGAPATATQPNGFPGRGDSQSSEALQLAAQHTLAAIEVVQGIVSEMFHGVGNNLGLAMQNIVEEQFSSAQPQLQQLASGS